MRFFLLLSYLIFRSSSIPIVTHYFVDILSTECVIRSANHVHFFNGKLQKRKDIVNMITQIKGFLQHIPLEP